MDTIRPQFPFCPPIRLPASAPFAEQLRRVPNQFRTFEEWFEYTHLDLAEMTTDQLLDDLAACRSRIAFEGRSSPWLFERYTQLEAKLATVGERAQ